MGGRARTASDDVNFQLNRFLTIHISLRRAPNL